MMAGSRPPGAEWYVWRSWAALIVLVYVAVIVGIALRYGMFGEGR